MSATEERELVEEAMRCVESNSAGHWPTVAGYLHSEVLRLRAQVDLMAKALQRGAYVHRDALLAAPATACPNTPRCEHPRWVHDVEDAEGNYPICCADGCTCGKPDAAQPPTSEASPQ